MMLLPIFGKLYDADRVPGQRWYEIREIGTEPLEGFGDVPRKMGQPWRSSNKRRPLLVLLARLGTARLADWQSNVH